jgi:hypothetical protein
VGVHAGSEDLSMGNGASGADGLVVVSNPTSFWFLLTWQNIRAKLRHLLLFFSREGSRARRRGGER